MNSFISSFKAAIVSLALILGVEGVLALWPPTITCLGSQPDLGDILNASADERSRRPSAARTLILGDSTAIYGVHPGPLEEVLGAPVLHVSRTLHYGFNGLRMVLEESLKSHPDVRLLVMPLSQRMFTASDEEAQRGGYLDRFLKAHNLVRPGIPSARLSGEVTRLIFFDPDRIYQGRHSFRQWQALCEEGRGSLRLPDIHRSSREESLREFNRPAQPGRDEALARLCRRAHERGLKVLIVMTPISASAHRVLEDAGALHRAVNHLKTLAGIMPSGVLFDPEIPVLPDDHFADTVHLNARGNETFSARVAQSVKAVDPALK